MLWTTIEVLWNQQGVRVMLGSAVAAALAVALILRSRRQPRWLAWAGNVLTCGFIVAVALPPRPLGPNHQQLSQCLRQAAAWTPDILSAEGFLNVALFVPLGLSAYAASRSFAVSMVTVLAVTLTVEALQAVTGWGGCTSRDVVANSVGGMAGAVLLLLRPARAHP